MSDKVYLTHEGYKKLKDELDHLKKVERRQIAQQIKEAREQGDLSENAEYDAAKEKQARNEYRIHMLQEKLSLVEIIKIGKGDSKEVVVGSSVELENLNDKTKLTYTLVDASEADFGSGKISISSPVAQGLLGHKQGEEVEIVIPAGILKFKIISIF
ncbi:MAG: transcription elongation factor GreA [Elusimicrobiota bacterium]